MTSVKDSPAVPTGPTNINLTRHDEPTTILCREIEDMVGALPWLWLGDAAPSPMELPWLQNLNLLLARITGICLQTSDWRKSVVDEAKRTLLCLANRRQLTGGQRVVTNEHLTRALYYFDVCMLVADVDYIYPGLHRDDFFRDYYRTCDEAPEDAEPLSNNQHDATSLTSLKPKTDMQNAAPAATAIPTGTKRKTSDDLRDERVNRTASSGHRARGLGGMGNRGMRPRE